MILYEKKFNVIIFIDIQREHFPFLGNNVAVTEMRCRSMFYTSLGRLLMVDLGEDEERFHTFMLPLTGIQCIHYMKYVIQINLDCT